MKPKSVFNWSTGKDSALALHRVLASGEYDVAWLLTSVNAQHERVSMHGVRTTLVEAQAEALGIPLVQVRLPDTPTMEAYERAMQQTLGELRAAGATVSIFGDIFLQDLRAYREQRLAAMEMQAIFPLWDAPTDALVREVISLGFHPVTTCVSERWLGREFVGRRVDDAFVRALPVDVDPCGEHGEFHTFVCDGPIFRTPVPVTIGEVVYRQYERPGTDDTQSDRCTTNSGATNSGVTGRDDDPFGSGFWYCDLLPAGTPDAIRDCRSQQGS